MKASNVKLHLNRKSAAAYTAAFLAIFLLLTIIVTIPTKGDLAQMLSFMRSSYVYSAIAPSSTADDAYLQYNAGISFSLSADAKAGINAEIVMQTADAKYTDLVDWNAERLGEHGIAVSGNISNKYRISVGDILYSKSIIDGEVYEYTVEAILPSITYTRGLQDDYHADGVIVMGYDEQYDSKITHTCIVFTAAPIDTLALQCSSMPEDIIYKEDEMASSFGGIAPYMAVYFLVSAISMVIFVMFFVKRIVHNFRRLIMLGFEKKALNSAYYCTISKAVLLAIIITAIISTVAFCGAGVSLITIAPVVCVLAAEIIAAILAATILNRQLWRK
ncbi:MAG: hypothetical protein ACI3YH_08455 [Eubacteriales bacterium]